MADATEERTETDAAYAGGDFTVVDVSLDPRGEETGEDRYTEHYSLRGTVGAGGVGRVLLAFDERIGREVAIKEMLSEGADPTFRARFVREAQITGRLEHPGIVPVYEVGTRHADAPFYVMRLIRGETLGKALAACDGAGPEERLGRRLKLLDRLIDVCQAMAYAHSKGIVHRDLKPGNVILGGFGETIILDWGLAKAEHEAEPAPDPGAAEALAGLDAGLTRQGAILGTPAYMAPEQVDGRFGAVDRRTDVFALGCMLYQILVGRPPLRGAFEDILAELVSERPMPSPRRAEAAVPPELAAICEKALAKDQAARFADAGELAQQLRSYRDGRLVSAYAYSRRELLRRFVARNKVAVAAALAVVAAIGVGGAFATKFAIEADAARRQAETALVDVIRLSAETLAASQRGVDTLAGAVATLADDMAVAATRAAAHDLADADRMRPLLSELKRRHPAAVSFLTIARPGTITAAFPREFDAVIGADISGQDHIRWIVEHQQRTFSRVFDAVEGFPAVTLQVPVHRDGEMVGMVAALLRAGDFAAASLPEDLRHDRLQVWIMQDDGTILHDRDPEEVGRNLMRDERYAAFPELRQLGERMLSHDTGIGHYQYTDGADGRRVHKVASWHTLAPGGDVTWKLVVVEPYVVGGG